MISFHIHFPLMLDRHIHDHHKKVRHILLFLAADHLHMLHYTSPIRSMVTTDHQLLQKISTKILV